MLEYSPLSHLIALALLAWLSVMCRRVAGGPELRAARYLLLGALLAWVAASSWIAYRGAYLALNASHLLLVWGTAAPYALVGALALASSGVRTLLRRFAEGISLESLAAVRFGLTVGEVQGGAFPGFTRPRASDRERRRTGPTQGPGRCGPP